MKPMESARRNSNGSAIWIKTMKKQKNTSPRFVVCLKNTDYAASLELHKIYRVLPDEDAAKAGDMRVVDESGEDYLYPASWFTEIRVPRPVQRSFSHLRGGATSRSMAAGR